MCRDLTDLPEQAMAIANRVHFVLHHPVMLAGGPIELSASIGVACARSNTTSDALVSMADQAMYAAKHQRNGPVLYEEEEDANGGIA